MIFDKLFLAFLFLLITLVTSSQTSLYVLGAPKSPEFTNSNACYTEAGSSPGKYYTTCCWTVVDAEGIELDYCQTCDYDPSTKTTSGCGEVYPSNKISPGSGRLPPGGLDDIPTLEQTPDSSPPQFGEGIKADIPLTEIIEQNPPNDTDANDEDKEVTDVSKFETRANISFNNENSD